jgi:hypothetical protein
MKSYPKVRDLERSHGVSWQQLTDLEPQLPQLLSEARQASTVCRRWSDVDRLFMPIRNTLVEVVGFASPNCRHEVLGSPGAYQVAYWKLYDAVAGLLPSNNSAAETGLEKPGTKSAAETMVKLPQAAAIAVA